jgi:hypothetical protein
MKKEKEIVLYLEPNEMLNQDQPADGKAGETKKKLLYFLSRNAEEFPPLILKGG